MWPQPKHWNGKQKRPERKNEAETSFEERCGVATTSLSFKGPRETSRESKAWYWNEEGGGASKESDVYGLGVIMLELLSGRGCEEGLIAKWAMPLIKEMSFGELLDARLVIPSDMKPLVRLAKVALACVGNSRKCRPSIAQVTTILNNIEMEVCI